MLPVTLRAPRPFLALLSLLVTLVTLCAACGGTDGTVAPDAAGDAAQDAARDAAPVEASADAAGDAPSDAAPDVIAPDAPEPADATAAADAREAGADVAQAGDAGADGRADAPGDAPVDASGDASADPLAAQVTALSVTARATDYAWTMPVSQSCAVTSGMVNISATYELPERAGFTFLGPSTLTMIGASGRAASDVRATIAQGPTYTLAGMQRTNVAVRGMIPGGLSIELVALGCPVR